MRRIAKPMTQLDAPTVNTPVVVGTFDVTELLDKGGEILRREIVNLMVESSGKKLSPTSARDLVAYVRLLSELKNEQEKALSEMTDEELDAIAKQD